MTTFVVGATGATGRLLVEQFLDRKKKVKVVVRTINDLPESIRNHKNITIIQASILELSDVEMAQYVKGCKTIASCLGHTLSFKGMFGQPRKLVTDATRRIYNSVCLRCEISIGLL